MAEVRNVWTPKQVHVSAVPTLDTISTHVHSSACVLLARWPGAMFF